MPKIAGGDLSESDTKRIFLEMLKTLKDVSFKDFFEVFIKENCGFLKISNTIWLVAIGFLSVMIININRPEKLWQKSVNVLLYPQSDAVRKTGIKYVSDDNVNVRVSFVDLKNVDDSISNLLTEVY